MLVTAINPTPLGEGKTTQSIGLAMAMEKIHKKAIVVLREPSLGPVFGVKGGAIGGGLSTIEPKDEINLHFTGDFHSITSANNLLCAVIENHIFQNKNNESESLHIDKISIKRVLDVNDRGLRNIVVNPSGKLDSNDSYKTGFEITAACELMAICCLSENIDELRKSIDNMIIGYTNENVPIFAKSLKVTNAMVELLKDTIRPNLVQTCENTPCIVHLGPFANIAHGCNSIIATKLGMKISDYCITEAGFGADLGAEKFFDIKCRKANIKPDIVVLVATIKALKYNGYESLEKLNIENIDTLENGFCNLRKHIENLKKYGVNVIVCINRYETDTENEICYLKSKCESIGVKAEISTAYTDGSNGAIKLAKLVYEELKEDKTKFKLLYEDDLSTKEKINKVCKEIYGAKNINYSDLAKEKLDIIQKNKFSNLPVCIAKTPTSLSDNDKLLGCPKNFDVEVKDIKINNGAGFIVVYLGNIMTLPGLSKKSKYLEF